MGRLTKRERGGITYNSSQGIMCSAYCDNCSQGTGNCDKVKFMVNKLAGYEDLEEQGLLVRLPCKVGDIVYVDSTILPIEDMEFYEDIDNKIPSYFQGRVVSFRFAQRNWVKIAVKAKWLYSCKTSNTEFQTGLHQVGKKLIHTFRDRLNI